MKQWQLLESKQIYSRYRTLVNKRYLMPDGEERDFEIKQEPDAAMIIAQTVEGKFLMVKEYRPGMDEVLFELPGGHIDEGEEPLEAAKRELLEETGFEGELTLAGTCYSCAYSDRQKYSFVARNCRQVADLSLDASEFIEVVQLDPADFVSNVSTGKLTDLDAAFFGLLEMGLISFSA